MKNEPLSLFAFDVFAPAHLTSGSWRNEGDQGYRYTDLQYWTGVAQMLEDAGFDGIFFADNVGYHDVFRGHRRRRPARRGTVPDQRSDRADQRNGRGDEAPDLRRDRARRPTSRPTCWPASSARWTTSPPAASAGTS